MDASEALGRILEAGTGAELAQTLRAIAESTAPDGSPRYSPKVVHALARAVVCRTYARPVFELCHLVNAADACGQGRDRYENFFFGIDRATPTAFRGHIARALKGRSWRRSGFQLTQEGIAIRYPDGLFNVRFGRMPFLAALLEFLITTVGYPELDEAFTALLSDPSREAAVKAAANRIAQQLYRYLGQHLRSQQHQAKFFAILEFLEGRSGGAELSVDDTTILDFWRARSAEEGGGDFRLFAGVFRAFLDFVRALETAESKAAIDRARSIGSDREAGEEDLETLIEASEPAGEWVSPLPLLDEEPAARIKFLNQRERGELDLLLDCGPLAERLPLSLLRAEVFGQAQARITQALRALRDKAAFQTLLRCDGAESYPARRDAYRGLLDHVGRMVKASLHVIATSPRRTAVGNVVGLAPDDPESAFRRFIDRSEDGDMTGPSDARLDGALDEARRAFEGISRRGFDDDAVSDADAREGFRTGAGVLLAITGRIEAYLARIAALDHVAPGLEGWFQRDRVDFASQFARVYGETT